MPSTPSPKMQSAVSCRVRGSLHLFSKLMLPTIDLFSGAGGFSLGAAMAGADVRLMVDNEPITCATAKLNPECHPRAQVVEGDVAKLTGYRLRELAKLTDDEPLLIVGGAPCQPFSKAAYWVDPGDEARYREARARGQKAEKPGPITEARPDERRTLIEEFWRLVVEAGATAFVLENVRSILHPRNKHVVEGLTSVAEQAGFAVRVVDANAAEYGVPQTRQRVFVIGVMGADEIPSPERTHDEKAADGLKAFVTAGEALAGLSGEEYHEPEEVVEGKWAEHLREIPPGSNYKHHTAWAGHPKPSWEAERRFWNFLLKLSPDRPSWTVPASPGPWTGPFHWASRRLRTVELAAIQTFPAGYKFAGSRRERVRQIGNAVPPLLASRMVEAALLAAGVVETSEKRLSA